MAGSGAAEVTDTARLDWVLAHDATVEVRGDLVYVSFRADGMWHVASYPHVDEREALDRAMQTHTTEQAGD